MKRALFCLVLILGLQACASVQMNAGKALLVSEAAVDGVNTSAIAAARSGACTGPCAVKLKGYVDSANQGVSRAHALYLAGKKAAAAAELATATDAIVEAQKSVGGQ